MNDTNSNSSSVDHQPKGVSVLSNGGAGFQREVFAEDDLADNDLVTIDGVQLTAKQAKSMGMMGKIFADGKAPEVNPEIKPAAAPKSDTGNAEYDTAIDTLNALVASGDISQEEAQTYDFGLAEVAMSGLTVEHVTETISGLADGSISSTDVPADVRAMVTSVETNVRRAATTAALNEMGRPAFDALSALANSHAGVNSVIQKYATDRAQGKHGGVTWAELAQDIQEQIGNA